MFRPIIALILSAIASVSLGSIEVASIDQNTDLGSSLYRPPLRIEFKAWDAPLNDPPTDDVEIISPASVPVPDAELSIVPTLEETLVELELAPALHFEPMAVVDATGSNTSDPGQSTAPEPAMWILFLGLFAVNRRSR